MFWKRKKDKPGKYRCSECGEIHKNWPALTYNSPTPYFALTESEKETIGELTSDFCIIEYEGQTDRFIRVVLRLKVNDYHDTLEYGLWVSLSEKSFKDYYENFESNNHEVSYFGWLSNYLPDYDNSQSVPMTVFTKEGNDRPEIAPHEDFDHQLVTDYYHGISKKEAEKRIHDMLKNVG
ncbi:MAG: DUF2199 domain-containing protein [Flavobacteriaceae bacterium]